MNVRLSQIFERLEIHKKFISDNVSQFENSGLKQSCDSVGIKKMDYSTSREEIDLPIYTLKRAIQA